MRAAEQIRADQQQVTRTDVFVVLCWVSRRERRASIFLHFVCKPRKKVYWESPAV